MSAAGASRWAQYGYDASNAAYNPLASGVKTDPDRSWTFETQGEVFGSATHVDGTVYAGSNDGHVYAVDADSGRERWRHRLGGSVIAAPGTVDGVTIGAGNDTVVALDSETGELRWEQSVENITTDTPPVIDGTVVASAAGGVHGLSLADGSRQWVTTEPETPWGMAAADGRVHVTDAENTHWALSVATGEVEWDLSGEFSWKPAVYDGRAVLGGDGFLAGVTADDGTVEWVTSGLDGTVIGAPSTDGTVVVVNLSRSGGDSVVAAYDFADGEELWERDALVGPSTPAIADGTVYLGEQDGLAVVDAESGSLRWEAGSENYGSPAVVDGRVFVANVSEGTVTAFEDSTAQFDRLADQKETLADVIDEISSVDLGDRERVDGIHRELSAAIDDDRLSVDVAVDAEQRLLNGERIADRTLRSVTSAEYPSGDDWDLARSSAGLTARSVVEIVVFKLLIKKVVANHVSAVVADSDAGSWLGEQLSDDAFGFAIDRLTDTLFELGKRATKWAVSFLASAIAPEEDATGIATAHRVLNRIEDRIDPLVEEFRQGVVDTGRAFRDRLSETIDTIVDWLAGLIRLPIEGVFVRGSLGVLHAGLDADRVVSDGVSGTATGASAAYDYGIDTIDRMVRISAESIAAATTDLGDIDLVGAALDAAESEDVGLIRRTLATIADFLWDLIGLFRRMAGAYIGWNGILETLLYHTNAVSGIVAGREPGPLPPPIEVLADLEEVQR